MVDYQPPQVGGDVNIWGTKVNAVFAVFNAEIEALKAKVGGLSSGPGELPVVQNLAVSDVTTTSARLSWTAPSSTGNLGTLTAYRISRGSTNVNTTSTSLPLQELTPNVEYSYNVTPVFTGGDGASRSASFTTLAAATPPPDPTPGGPGSLPNGNAGFVFAGTVGATYFQRAQEAAFNVQTTGSLTIEAWVYMNSVNQGWTESENYNHWLGKGTTSGASFNQEYVFRYYNMNTSATDRPGAFSAYHFGEWDTATSRLYGNGARINSSQGDAVAAGEWFHIVGTWRQNGTIGIYKNGVKGGTSQNFMNATYQLTFPPPGGVQAPFRIGTRQEASGWQGKIACVAVYSYEMPIATVQSHYNTMTGSNPSSYNSLITGQTGLVAYWPLNPASSPNNDISGAGRHLIQQTR